jgi:hypothetical protein
MVVKRGDVQRLSSSSLYTFRERLCYYVLTILLPNQNAPQPLRFAAGGCALLWRSCTVTAECCGPWLQVLRAADCGLCAQWLRTAEMLRAAAHDRNEYTRAYIRTRNSTYVTCFPSALWLRLYRCNSVRQVARLAATSHDPWDWRFRVWQLRLFLGDSICITEDYWGARSKAHNLFQ